MRLWLFLGALMTAGVGSAPAIAQTRQQVDQCEGRDGASPDAVIAACTALLELRVLPSKLRAVVLTNRAVGHSGKGQHDLAVQGLDRSIRLEPDQGFPYIVRGSAYDELGQYERALQDFGKAIALDPNQAEAFFNRAVTYARKGDNERALKDYNRTTERRPAYTPAILDRCRLTARVLGLTV